MANAPLITYPAELTTARWKKAKSIFTNNTGISETLRKAEAAFKAASGEIDTINKAYKGDVDPTALNGYKIIWNDFGRLVISAQKGKIAAYKAALWAVRDRAKAVASEKKLLPKQKALVLEMAQIADRESVVVNANTISSYLGKELDSQKAWRNDTLEKLFGPENLKRVVTGAAAFIKKVEGAGSPAAQLKMFNDGIGTATRNITQVLGNRAMSQKKMKISYAGAADAERIFKALAKWADGYKGATATTLKNEIAAVKQWIVEAGKHSSGKIPTVDDIS